MFYDRELNFFRKCMENLKIKTTLISESNVPDDIDAGIRRLLNATKEYDEFFNIDFTYKENTVSVICDIFLCTYIFIPLPDCAEKSVLVLGPYTKSLVTNKSLRKKTAEIDLSKDIIFQLEKYYTAVPYYGNDETIIMLVTGFGETIYSSLENFTITHKTLKSDIDTVIFSNTNRQEKEIPDPWMSIQLLERRYSVENELIDAVSRGLSHKAEMIFGNIKFENVTESRIPDSLRNIKNYMIILNTLLRKAAEKGKVHPIHIDGVSSDFALRIEAMQNVNECEELLRYMVKKYCRLVNKHSQQGYSLVIQKVITQIEADVTTDLSLKNLASIFKVNPSYLSSLFKKETNTTLTDYVNKTRTEHAKVLLTTTNLQIQTIAVRCGVLDVNYFTKIFKKHTGLTPKKYRDKYGK